MDHTTIIYSNCQYKWIHGWAPKPKRSPRPCPAREHLHTGRCVPVCVPPFEGRRALCAVPPAGTAGGGAGGAAGFPAGAEAAGLCKEQGGRRAMALSCGSAEEPQDRPAGGAGCVDQRRCGVIWEVNYGRNSLYRGNAHRQSGRYAAARSGHLWIQLHGHRKQGSLLP